MGRWVFLHVNGGDYSALSFEENYDPQEFYEVMIKENKTQTMVETSEFYADVKIEEFEDIDDNFIAFIRNYIMDYDRSKDNDFFEVKPQ